jgi:hypothetical protein
MVGALAASGSKVVDMVLINMRRTLLQTRCEVLALPPLHATFMHKVASSSHLSYFIIVVLKTVPYRIGDGSGCPSVKCDLN